MIIVKIGGGQDINLEGIAKDLKLIREPVIIVHGANALRDFLAEALKRPVKKITSISGYTSVHSDEDTIDLQMMAYAGLKNKRLVELLQQQNINAVGLCGIDGGVIRGKRNAGIRIKEQGKLKLLRDHSGKPQSINKKLLDMLLDNDFVPVLTVPIIDENNCAINSENDDIVALLHKEYHAQSIVHLIEAPGFLQDPNDPASVLHTLSLRTLTDWENRSTGRIKRKLLAIKRLCEGSSTKIFIGDGRIANPLQNALDEKGTVVRWIL